MPCVCCSSNAVGACCSYNQYDQFNVCSQKSKAECDAIGGFYLGNGTECVSFQCFNSERNCTLCCVDGWPTTLNVQVSVSVSNLPVSSTLFTGFPVVQSCRNDWALAGPKTANASLTLTRLSSSGCPKWSFGACSDVLFGDFGYLGVEIQHLSPFQYNNCSYAASVNGIYFTCVQSGNRDAECNKGYVMKGSFDERNMLATLRPQVCSLSGITFSTTKSYTSPDYNQASINGNCTVYSGDIDGCNLVNVVNSNPPVTPYTVSVTVTVL